METCGDWELDGEDEHMFLARCPMDIIGNEMRSVTVKTVKD